MKCDDGFAFWGVNSVYNTSFLDPINPFPCLGDKKSTYLYASNKELQ